MTQEEFASTPLFSFLLLTFGSLQTDGVLIKKSTVTPSAIVYDFTNNVVYYSIQPSMIQLYSRYQPLTDMPYPTGFDSIPDYSIVRVLWGSMDRKGILMDRAFEPYVQGSVFFTDTDTFGWFREEYIRFVSAPPGCTFVTTAPPETPIIPPIDEEPPADEIPDDEIPTDEIPIDTTKKNATITKFLKVGAVLVAGALLLDQVDEKEI